MTVVGVFALEVVVRVVVRACVFNICFELFLYPDWKSECIALLTVCCWCLTAESSALPPLDITRTSV